MTSMPAKKIVNTCDIPDKFEEMICAAFKSFLDDLKENGEVFLLVHRASMGAGKSTFDEWVFDLFDFIGVVSKDFIEHQTGKGKPVPKKKLQELCIKAIRDEFKRKKIVVFSMNVTDPYIRAVLKDLKREGHRINIVIINPDYGSASDEDYLDACEHLAANRPIEKDSMFGSTLDPDDVQEVFEKDYVKPGGQQFGRLPVRTLCKLIDDHPEVNFFEITRRVPFYKSTKDTESKRQLILPTREETLNSFVAQMKDLHRMSVVQEKLHTQPLGAPPGPGYGLLQVKNTDTVKLHRLIADYLEELPNYDASQVPLNFHMTAGYNDKGTVGQYIYGHDNGETPFFTSHVLEIVEIGVFCEGDGYVAAGKVDPDSIPKEIKKMGDAIAEADGTTFIPHVTLARTKDIKAENAKYVKYNTKVKSPISLNTRFQYQAFTHVKKATFTCAQMKCAFQRLAQGMSRLAIGF